MGQTKIKNIRSNKQALNCRGKGEFCEWMKEEGYITKEKCMVFLNHRASKKKKTNSICGHNQAQQLNQIKGPYDTKPEVPSTPQPQTPSPPLNQPTNHPIIQAHLLSVLLPFINLILYPTYPIIYKNREVSPLRISERGFRFLESGRWGGGICASERCVI